MEKTENKVDKRSKKQIYEVMRFTYVGNISEVVKGGGGKLSLAGGDPGEGRKQQGGNN